MLAHEARPRIGRPREQGRAGGIGSMAYEIMARNCSEKTSTRGRSLQLWPAPDRSYRERASTNGSRLKPLRRPFRTTENTEHTEKENTQDAVKAEEEITHGDRQDQEIATRGSRLRAGTLGSRPSLLVAGFSDCLL
jgi:hypothetical protein